MAEAPQRYCTNCGHELRPEDQFCPNCGTPVHQAAHVPTPEADVPVPPPPQQIEPASDQQAHPAGDSPAGDRRADALLWGFVGAAVLLVLLGLLFQSGGYVFLGVVAGFLALIRWQFPRFLSRAAEGEMNADVNSPVVAKTASNEPIESEAERSRLLEDAMHRYLRNGFSVAARTPTTAQLVKPKRFSFVWALVWFLVFGIGLVVYLLYYAAKKDERIYLEVDKFGTVRATRQGR